MEQFLRYLLILTAGFATATSVWASDDSSFVNYDSLVNELKASAEDDEKEPDAPELNWDEVALHAGMALATSYVNVKAPNGVRGSGIMKGFELFVGANLFTSKLRGELAFRNFAPEILSRDMSNDLKEFEARMILLPTLGQHMVLRMGFGLTARSMDLATSNNGRNENFDSSVGATALILGLERKISPAVSIGPDFAYRSSLSTTSFDQSAWDASLKLNASF